MNVFLNNALSLVFGRGSGRRAGRAVLLAGALGLAGPAGADEPSVSVVAAESSYGSMVETIGGEHVRVTSLLDSPDVNPHEFKGSPRIGRQLQHADLVVMNGAGFDGWMEPLLEGTHREGRVVVRASEAGSAMIMADNNWHLFYSPRIMLATAGQVTRALIEQDPAHKSDYRDGLEQFRKELLPVYDQIQQLIAEYPNLTVTATVPVYNYMIRLLGYQNLYHDVQFASMRNSQPSARQVSEFLQGLKQHRVRLLIYNRQVHNRLTESEVRTAREAGVPVVGVSAIPLHGDNYAQWQIRQLRAIEQALDNAAEAS
ncbi:zinc/manganese transport system substrate-binding protein [Kushneria sinocarnis]|uniref:Zinc/manganese transport system substrate-binding protein n=1 Tax=Kushneria sinocarnis TaxID=595502 RepID=A0A420WU80_9GAMM|nr:zinc ABC transporter substrate-binding protein [Kushneria sinocarnis]RKQ96998.1 zinc/manganese transport system substrate-binding protein [Kushneria sinocarnis]